MSIKTVLLTGARAPVTLDLARSFAFAGYRVICVDTIQPTLCHYSRAVDKVVRVTSPSLDLESFTNELNAIINDDEVDLLIPTCEEALYISLIKDKIKCSVFSMDFAIVEKLHNKWKFYELIQSLCLPIPKTWLIRSEEDLQELSQQSKLIFKQTYSRFAAKLIVKHVDDDLPKLSFDASNPHLAQEFIEGVSFCSYCIAHEGSITGYAEYEAIQSIGIGSAIAFKSTQHREIFTLSEALVKKLNYTGQIAFDFIRDKKGQFFIIECNPRAISGIHLFDYSPKLSASFVNKEPIFVAKGMYKRDLMISLWYGIKQREMFRWEFWCSLFKGKSPFFLYRDLMPTLMMPRIIWDVMKRTFFERKGLHQVMSCDIEYNGDLK